MSSYELYIPPKYTGRNAKTGRFMKGHVPANKGKKWSDYMGKRAMRKAMKGWKNLDNHRPKNRPDTAGRCRKEVIAVMDDGTWRAFSYLGAAALWIGGSRENIGRCCRENMKRKPLRKPWGKPAGKVNTNHRYKGVRWYFEEDNIWTTKIIQS